MTESSFIIQVKCIVLSRCVVVLGSDCGQKSLAIVKREIFLVQVFNWRYVCSIRENSVVGQCVEILMHNSILISSALA